MKLPRDGLYIIIVSSTTGYYLFTLSPTLLNGLYIKFVACGLNWGGRQELTQVVHYNFCKGFFPVLMQG